LGSAPPRFANPDLDIETTPFDLDLRESESYELRQLQLRYRAEVIRDRDWASFAGKGDLRAELAELRFPWEPPRPKHKPCNLPFKRIVTLCKGRDAFLDELHPALGGEASRGAPLARPAADAVPGPRGGDLGDDLHPVGGVGTSAAGDPFLAGLRADPAVPVRGR